MISNNKLVGFSIIICFLSDMDFMALHFYL